MKFLPLIGAVVFFVIAQVVLTRYGTTGGAIAAILMLALWWVSYVWKEKKMDRLWHELNELPAEKRIELLSNADDDLRDSMLKRDAKKKPIKSA